MNPEFRKKLASALGVDPSTLNEKQLKAAFDLYNSQPGQQAPTVAELAMAVGSPESGSLSSVLDPETKAVVNDSVRKSLVSDPQTEEAKQRDLAEQEIANRMSPERGIVADSRGSYKNDLRKFERERTAEEAAIRKEVYGERGLEIPKSLPGADKPDALRDSRLPGMAERNKPAQAEAARRDTVRSDARVNIEKNLYSKPWSMAADGSVSPGRAAFADQDGRVVGPAQLQQELIAGGMNRNDANIAAGQRSRDMFDLPNAKSQGWGMRGGQRDAVLNAAPEDRMTIMEGLRGARRDNLQELTRQRRENPGAAGFSRKEVGRVMQIETQDGQILAKRTPDGQGMAAANGTTGRRDTLELTDAGDRAIRDRTTAVKTSQTALAAYDESGGQGNVVTGKHGYSIGGVSGENLKVENGKLVAKALTTSRNQGTVDSKAGVLMDKFPGVERGIDQRWATYEKNQKDAASRQLGADYLKAFEDAGGPMTKPKPGAAPSGPRTKEDLAAMGDFLAKPPEKRSEIVKGLTASPEGAKKGESEEAKRKRLLASGPPK